MAYMVWCGMVVTVERCKCNNVESFHMGDNLNSNYSSESPFSASTFVIVDCACQRTPSHVAGHLDCLAGWLFGDSLVGRVLYRQKVIMRV
jgi:hypothetical protein